MLKTFADAVRFLESYIPEPLKKHPGRLGLERMENLVSLLGNPQFKYLTIHVGGTSGKGSTATIIASILAKEFKVGLHTSPHLEKVTERMKIIVKVKAVEEYGIPDGEFIKLVNKIQPIINKAEESRFGRPSYFEIVTALSFLYFAEQKVDIAVIEVGMGGRFDATNVIKPLAAVITNVNLDHAEVLGKTIEEIAEDKAGIIKPGIQAVAGVNQPSVVEIIRKRCKEKKARLSLLIPQPSRMASGTSNVPATFDCGANLEGFLRLGHPRGGFGADVFPEFSYNVRKISSKGSVFDYFGENTYKNLKLSLLGKHQIKNACLAIQVIENLNNNPITPASPAGRQSSNNPINKKIKNISISDKERSLSSVFIPGRLEIVSRKPLIVLDGAHNPDKMKSLIAAIKSIFPGKKVTCIIAIKKGKDAKSMLSFLIPICSKVIFTKFKLTTDLGDTYSYEPGELIELAQNSSSIFRIVNNSQEAVVEAIKKTKNNDLILVTGSLYLIGEIRKFLIFKQKDN